MNQITVHTFQKDALKTIPVVSMIIIRSVVDRMTSLISGGIHRNTEIASRFKVENMDANRCTVDNVRITFLLIDMQYNG